MEGNNIYYIGTPEEVERSKTAMNQFLQEWNNDNDRVLVHTSGSTGIPKPLWVEKERMLASARTTCDFLGLRPGDSALLCMSLDYIAGKMMVVRALERKLRLYVAAPSGHPLKQDMNEVISFAAMVPLQVYNTLQVGEERSRLMEIRHLIIGGGAIDEAMARELKDFPHAVWSTYGMTETLSHIALRRLSGETVSCFYTPFDGVRVSVDKDQCLVIDAPMVCDKPLTTNDIAELSSDGRRFRLLGRKDNVICSGGIKIQIEEVERLLRPHFPMPFMVTKVKDRKFGEAVVLLIENGGTTERVGEGILPKLWTPRYTISVDHLPMTETGKPARAEAERLANVLLKKDNTPICHADIAKR